MNTEINYKNNPLHGVSLKNLLVEIVDYYGFDILYAYLNINAFKNNPSIDSSLKFLKKTDWAREKVESFFLYQYKNLPRPTSEQLLLSPRDRIIPDDQSPGEPAELNLEDAERLREKSVRKSDAYGKAKQNRYTKNKPVRSQSSSSSTERPVDPWAKMRNKSSKQD